MSALAVYVPGVFSLLNNASGRPPGTTVHTHVPENADQPYFRVGEAIETPGRPFGNRGFNELVRVHAFSRQRGNKQCLAMVEWAHQVMDGNRISLAGFGSASLSVVDTTVNQDPDGTYHGILAVRARPIGS